MFSTPEELALRVISEYKEQNFSNLKQPCTEEESKTYYYSRWALDEASIFVLCSQFGNLTTPSDSIKVFQALLEKKLDSNDENDETKYIFSIAHKVITELLELFDCYQYEYFMVM